MDPDRDGVRRTPGGVTRGGTPGALARRRPAVDRVFGPGQRLLSRLGLVQKFALVLVILAVPLSVISFGYLTGAAADHAFTERELAGTSVLGAAVHLSVVVAEAPWAPVDTDELDAARAAFDAAVEAEDLPRSAEAWQDVDRRLADLAGPTDSTDTAAATAAVESLRRLLITVGDESNLTLDPELDSYYLMDAAQYRYPALIAVAAESDHRDATLRALGASVDERWDIELDLARLLAAELASLAQGQTTVAMRTQDAVVAANATARAADARRRADAINAAVANSSAIELGVPVGPADLSGIRTAALDAMPAPDELEADWRASLVELRRLLDVRLGEMDDRSSRLLALALACLTVAVYLVLSLFSGLLRSLREMRRVLARAGAGDLSATVRPEGADELAEVSIAINETVARVAAAQDELRHRATHDGLTGLPNRQRFVELLESLMPTARPDAPLAIGFVDLDSFKAVNDLHGHHNGDLVLRTVAARLQETAPPGSICSRLAGDEYAVLVPPGLSSDRVRRAMEALLRAVAEPIDLPDHPSRVMLEGASLGLAFHHGDHRLDAEGLLAAADFAMYDAKTSGPGQVREFTDELAAMVRRRSAMRGELTRALGDPRRSGLAVVYQPIVDLHTDAVIGVEALSRWWSPSLGPVPPSEFVPLAEDIGLITTLGQFVLGEATQQLARGQRHEPDLYATVNVSALALTDGLLELQVEQAAAGAGVAPETLWLELTESAMMTDPDIAAKRISSIRRRGHPVAVDDFGTGHSSLAYLHSLELSALKIDRTFVSALDDPSASTNRHILHMTLDLARHLRLDVVAEGIETTAQRDELVALGVRRGQGYLLHRPMSGEVLDQLLTAAGHPAMHD